MLLKSLKLLEKLEFYCVLLFQSTLNVVSQYDHIDFSILCVALASFSYCLVCSPIKLKRDELHVSLLSQLQLAADQPVNPKVPPVKLRVSLRPSDCR